MHMMNKSLLALGIVTAFVSLVVISANVYAAVSGNTITACVGKDGTLKFSADGTTCAKGQTLLSWNIQGPKGDMGPQGPQGEPGPKGDKGDPGEGGSTLHVWDANGQDLGTLISTGPSFSSFTTYIPELGIVLQLQNGQTVTIGNTDSLWFHEENCQGIAYGRGGNPGGTVVSRDGRRGFKFTDGAIVYGDDFFKSRFDDRCYNGQGGPGGGIPMEEVTLPFSLPLAGPLEIH